MIKKKIFLPALLFASVNSVVPQNNISTTEKSDTDQRPNILFILSDDHTSQAWGVYGGVLSEYVKNENIRRLAAEGCVLQKTLIRGGAFIQSFHFQLKTWRK